MPAYCSIALNYGSRDIWIEAREDQMRAKTPISFFAPQNIKSLMSRFRWWSWHILRRWLLECLYPSDCRRGQVRSASDSTNWFWWVQLGQKGRHCKVCRRRYDESNQVNQMAEIGPLSLTKNQPKQVEWMASPLAFDLWAFSKCEEWWFGKLLLECEEKWLGWPLTGAGVYINLVRLTDQHPILGISPIPMPLIFPLIVMSTLRWQKEIIPGYYRDCP